MQRIKNLINKVWASDGVRRVVHTFWQAAGGALIASLVVARSTADVKLSVAAAVAAGLAAVKSLIVSQQP